MTIDKDLPSIWKEGFVPRRSRGQHFLVNQSILEKIVREAALSGHDLVIEVGTGPGNLTGVLARSGARVISFESDTTLYQFATRRLAGQTNVQIRHQDFLTVDLKNLVAEYPESHYAVVANLPYAITSPILFKILESAITWRTVLVMVQQEFADRLLSPPGTRNSGRLSLAASLTVKVERIMKVSRRSFRPIPKVDSTVLRLTLHRQQPDDTVIDRVKQLARLAFAQRRKQLVATLGDVLGGRESFRERLDTLGISGDSRPESLTTEQWIHLAQLFP